jgi:hypothetical protein
MNLASDILHFHLYRAKALDELSRHRCAACRTEWEKRREAERERECAKQREWYRRRKERRLLMAAPTVCESCGTKFKGRRKGARFCSDTCRQRAHRTGLSR